MDFYEYDETHLILKHYRYVPENDEQNASRREELNALISVAKYRPKLTLGIVGLGMFAAALEGVGLSFILPIVEIVQASGDPAQQTDGGLMGAFVLAYQR